MSEPRTTCLMCGKRMRMDILARGLGYDGDGFFCTLRCGYHWALWRLREDAR